MSLAKVANASDILPGQMIDTKLDETGVLIANVEGNFYAITSICTHRNCNLAKGRLKGAFVTCPCHASRFDVTTGEVLHGPATKPAKTFKVVVQDNDVLIES